MNGLFIWNPPSDVYFINMDTFDEISEMEFPSKIWSCVFLWDNQQSIIQNCLKREEFGVENFYVTKRIMFI